MTCCVPAVILALLPPLGPTLPIVGTGTFDGAPLIDSTSGHAPALASPDDGAADALLLSADPMSAETLRARSGGTADYSVDLGALGINVATTNGTVTDVNLTDTQTGDATGTNVLDNAGITTVFVNTGNGVVLQNTVQVNVFTTATD